ncbi:MAG: acyl-CoA thioesterase II [Kordiimonadaceae bacterium]|nr:acyl-CoA thioesterase II [Kordiimonadaceae bacterium]
MSIVQNIIDSLAIEKLEKFMFRGNPNDWPSRHVFGGHVVAQAMAAADMTVGPEQTIHSIHCYFMRPGISRQPILYDVDPIRDGRSFATRRVLAVQNGEAIFAMTVSFHVGEEGVSHQIDMPEVPGPDALADGQEYFGHIVRNAGKKTDLRELLPFEWRAVDPMDPDNLQAKSPVTGHWLRLREKTIDDPALHARLLGYISDFSFLSSNLRPHALVPRSDALKTVASIDHTMWLHSNDFRMDEWIYYKTEGYWAGKGRGLSRGALYTQEGRLIASTAQESLLRLTQETKDTLSKNT